MLPDPSGKGVVAVTEAPFALSWIAGTMETKAATAAGGTARRLQPKARCDKQAVY